jgi:hypothetical protein
MTVCVGYYHTSIKKLNKTLCYAKIIACSLDCFGTLSAPSFVSDVLVLPDITSVRYGEKINRSR